MSPVSKPNFSIRPVTPSDVATVHGLVGQLAVYEKLEHMVTGTPAMLHESLFGARPVCECVIAEEDGAPVGFALYFISYSTFLAKGGLYLEDLFVVPSVRGRGYGKALIVHLASIAQQRGYGRFEWRVLDWNTPSIDFYKSLGASVMPEWYLVRMTAPEIAALIASES